jgi:hypothetical protein
LDQINFENKKLFFVGLFRKIKVKLYRVNRHAHHSLQLGGSEVAEREDDHQELLQGQVRQEENGHLKERRKTTLCFTFYEKNRIQLLSGAQYD